MSAGAYTIAEDPADARNFFVTPRPKVEVPEDQQTLHIEIQRILNALDQIYPRDVSEFSGPFAAARSELMGWARVGLEADPAQTALVLRALPVFKEDLVTREAGRIKNMYMRRLGRNAFWMALAAAVVCVLALNFDAITRRAGLIPPMLSATSTTFVRGGADPGRQPDSAKTFAERAQELGAAGRQGKEEANALAVKVDELAAAVKTLGDDSQIVLTKADETDKAAQAPADDVKKLEPQAQELSAAAREIAEAAQSRGASERWAKPLACFAMLWIGCMAGVWLSFGYRKTKFGFDDLVVLEADSMEPRVRLIFAGLMTLLIGFFFYKKVITIEVGEMSTGQIADDLLVAVILGAVCGFSELVLGTKVAQRAAAFLEWK